MAELELKIGSCNHNAKAVSEGLMIGIILGCLLLAILIILVAWVVRKKIKINEELVIENNPDYNEDDEYYNEHDNRVVDTNDYYQ